MCWRGGRAAPPPPSFPPPQARSVTALVAHQAREVAARAAPTLLGGRERGRGGGGLDRVVEARVARGEGALEHQHLLGSPRAQHLPDPQLRLRFGRAESSVAVAQACQGGAIAQARPSAARRASPPLLPRFLLARSSLPACCAAVGPPSPSLLAPSHPRFAPTRVRLPPLISRTVRLHPSASDHPHARELRCVPTAEREVLELGAEYAAQPR
jgi:hypothetical protein